jgi:hypothetical protein
MVNRIGLLISIGIVGLLSYLKGYVDGSFYGYILGRRIGERNGRIQELINSVDSYCIQSIAVSPSK